MPPKNQPKNPPKLLQLLIQNQDKPREIRSEVDGDEATIYLYDIIDDWYGVSAQAFVTLLASITAETTHVRINSPGGDVFAARAMATAIKGHKGKVICHIDGVCASAATYVALAGAEVHMAEGAFFMIHQAWTWTYGNSDQLTDMAAVLQKIDVAIANDYVKKTGKSHDEVTAWMKAETWFSAQEAKEVGFIDKVFDIDETIDNKWDLSAYANAPKPTAPKHDAAEETRVMAHRERHLRLLELGPA